MVWLTMPSNQTTFKGLTRAQSILPKFSYQFTHVCVTNLAHLLLKLDELILCSPNLTPSMVVRYPSCSHAFPILSESPPGPTCPPRAVSQSLRLKALPPIEPSPIVAAPEKPELPKVRHQGAVVQCPIWHERCTCSFGSIGA